MDILAVVAFISAAVTTTGAEGIGDNVKTLVEGLISDIVNEKVNEMRKEFQAVTDDLRKSMRILERENVKQKAVIDELKGQLEQLASENRRKHNNIHTGNTTFNGKHQDVNAENLTENSAIKQDLPLSAAVLRGRRVGPGNIAFCAYLTRTQTHLTGEAVRFDQVLLNDGGGYNSYTGAFTAPLSGVYLFNFHFDVTNKISFVRLVINGVNQVDGVANQHTNPDNRRAQSMGGNTAIVHVNHGQAVLIEVYEIADVEVASSNTFRLSTFSGVLLY